MGHVGRFKMKSVLAIFLSAVLAGGESLAFSRALRVERLPAQELTGTPAPWAYDPGPDPRDPMGKELINLVASQPNMPRISEELTGLQKFRPDFGPTLWRMPLEQNTIQVLFIGQDGTHVAEAAGRTATAGFGGRAQDLAAYFGVRHGTGFINAFAYTIQGQYGAFETPVITEREGKKSVQFTGVVDNGLWLMSQDVSSPMVKWRNGLIDWIIRNNRDSLKLIVLFGGGARDSIGSFVESKLGPGSVGTRYSPEDFAKMQVPSTLLKYAGGNNQFPAVVDAENRDLYAELLGRSRVNYSKPEEVAAAKAALEKNLDKALPRMALSQGGLGGSGLLHPAQLGGYNLDKMQIDGREGRSLRGLPLADGTKVAHDIVVVNSPHPTALSMMEKAEASAAVKRALEPIRRFPGWRVNPEPGLVSAFAAGRDYEYARTELPDAHYDHGTPKNRKVSKSDASRLSPDVVILGTRDKAVFNEAELSEARKATPAEPLPDGQLLTNRHSVELLRGLFDRGPGLDLARIMHENIDMSVIGRPKPGMSFERDGIAAFNVKTHPENVGPFGHYRGRTDSPRVLVLADPHGFDDMLSSRALTGERGQYLQGLMDDLGVKDRYLLLKTVPFGMDGATASEWSQVLEQTRAYREKLLAATLAKGQPEAIVADGPHAAQEIRRILGAEAKIPVIEITRVEGDAKAGFQEAARDLAKIPAFTQKTYRGARANIPPTHLPYLTRAWQGTTGCCVINATNLAHKGLGFAVVVPEFASAAKVALTSAEQAFLEEARARLDRQGLPRPNEKLSDARERLRERLNTERESTAAPARSCSRVLLDLAG